MPWPAAFKRGCLLLSVAAVVTIIVAFLAADRGMCGNDVCHEYPAPSGTKRLVMYQRSCGATTYWSVHARIVFEGAELPNDSGLVLMNHGTCLGRDAELPSIGVTWRADERVTITYPGLVSSDTTMNGVHVGTSTGAAQ
jgi:hypothetical protein